MKKCKQCNKETTNPVFCSRKCSATWNNKYYPKRFWVCSRCGDRKDRPSKSATICKECRLVVLDKKYLTLGELRKAYKDPRKIRQNVFSYIREQARRKALALGMTFCVFCGYNKFVEIAHKIPVHKFPDSATIEEINNIENLISLCPNCHWEFDHN